MKYMPKISSEFWHYLDSTGIMAQSPKRAHRSDAKEVGVQDSLIPAQHGYSVKFPETLLLQAVGHPSPSCNDHPDFYISFNIQFI
jgi:hypothetical protein